MSKLHHALLVLALACASVPAHAEDAAVVQRLSSNGGLSSAGSKRLIAKVKQRMNKAADTLASASDPLRVAMSQALFNRPVPPDNMAAAKMRLKLYAGLNESALEALFAPKAGAVASCVRAVGATQVECEALVAAAGRTSVAEVRSNAGGPAVAVAVVAPPRAQPAPASQGGSRFGHYDSGFGHGNAAPAAAPSYAAAPATRPQHSFGARPAPAAATPATGQAGMSQKEVYRLRREAYLARQKARFEARKQKVEAASAPAESAPSEVATSSAAKAAPDDAVNKAPVKADVAAAQEPAPAEEPAQVAKGNDKPTLDSDFLDGLLEDPLGKK